MADQLPQIRGHVTVEKSRKSLKIQQALAFLTMVLGIVLIGVGSQEGGASHPATQNGITTFGLSMLWMLAVRVATWWHHG